MSKTYSLNQISLANLALAALMVVLLIYYVVVANSITAWNYKIQKLSGQLLSLSEIGSSLIAQRAFLESTELLVNFAKTNNMVEAKNVSYLFENKNVALVR